MNWINEIKEYIPYNEQENADKEAILYAIDNCNNLLTRENLLAHITSSGYIVNKDRTKVLMIYHNIYNSWSWTGGHADGDEDLLYVAIKEAKEETGVTQIEPLMEEIASIDILPVWGHVKKDEYVATHMHLSVAYILIADENQHLQVNEAENSGVKWVEIEALEAYCKEPQIVEIYHKLIRKAKSYKKA